ncbi:endonuclease/exonuclease/phosphatase family protein [Maritalea sp.]|uniref:endonuclease/exonuclease/phosphatase family protein n=1 Tax=Maritalea sp. TaxID=2003361 RepID=UPI003EF89215
MAKKIWRYIALLFFVMIVLVVIIVGANRQPEFLGQWVEQPSTQMEDARMLLGDQLSLLSWNIGYGALGEGADFIADGGTKLISSEKSVVLGNNKAVAALLAQQEFDIYLLQEVSDGSILNHWVDQFTFIQDALHNYAQHFRKDVSTRFLPWPLRINHGTIFASRTEAQEIEIVPLPLEPGHLMGFIKRRYGLQVARFDRREDDQQWVVVNLHLSAFDKGDVRINQVKAVLRFAQEEFAKGHFVVVGGDWNMEIEPSTFPHDTAEEFLFWLRPFPKELLPERWQIVSDSKVPTVRTLHKPYVAGGNYVASIDGFLISPNVELLDVAAIDLNFANTDHHPIRIDVRAKH